MIDREDLLAELRSLADGETAPTIAELHEHGQYSQKPYIDRWGSWSAACRAAGLSMDDRAIEVSDEELCAELRRLADDDMGPTATTMDRRGKYTAETYRDRFGSWEGACRAADLTPPTHPRSISTDALLAELERLAESLGTTPTQADMESDGAYDPGTYHDRFGSWIDACKEAGLSPDHRGTTLTDDELLAELKRLADGDDPPTTTEMEDEGAYSATAYRNHFGSWNDACREAGLTTRSPREPIPEEDLLAELQQLAVGSVAPTMTAMSERSQYSASTYVDRFGSWPAACEAADLIPRYKDGELTEAALCAELRRLADGDIAPTAATMNRDGLFSATPYYTRFGGWPQACRAAGLTPPSNGPTN